MRRDTSTSIGTVETWGYTAAVAALDVGLKAANVVFDGYRVTPSGLVAITFRGDVAAVRTAVDAAVAAAAKVGRIAAHHVIGRPHEQLRQLFEQPRPAAGCGPPGDPRGATAAARKPRGTAPRGQKATDLPADAPKTRGKASLLKKTTSPTEPPPRPAPTPRKRTGKHKRREEA